MNLFAIKKELGEDKNNRISQRPRPLAGQDRHSVNKFIQKWNAFSHSRGQKVNVYSIYTN